MRIMGIERDRAFLNLQGDGIVVVDISKPAAPIGVSFLWTLGYATHLIAPCERHRVCYRGVIP
jgi:hypothetical protein